MRASLDISGSPTRLQAAVIATLMLKRQFIDLFEDAAAPYIF